MKYSQTQFFQQRRHLIATLMAGTLASVSPTVMAQTYPDTQFT